MAKEYLIRHLQQVMRASDKKRKKWMTLLDSRKEIFFFPTKLQIIIHSAERIFLTSMITIQNSDVTLTPHDGRWCWILNQLSVTSFFSVFLVTDNWFKIQRHLPSCDVNVTSEWLVHCFSTKFLLYFFKRYILFWMRWTHCFSK